MDRIVLKINEEYELREFQPVGSSCLVVARRAKSDAGSEAQSPYNYVFALEKCALKAKNNYFWQIF